MRRSRARFGRPEPLGHTLSLADPITPLVRVESFGTHNKSFLAIRRARRPVPFTRKSSNDSMETTIRIWRSALRNEGN